MATVDLSSGLKVAGQWALDALYRFCSVQKEIAWLSSVVGSLVWAVKMIALRNNRSVHLHNSRYLIKEPEDGLAT